jgi:lipopolysaccharide transport system ATP-binding protein
MRADVRDVLTDFSLDIQRGESIAVLGRNGAGKSTLLALIAGVIRPTSGSLHVGGRVSPLLELGAGFHPELSGRENVMLNGVLLGLRRAEVAARMSQIVEFSELEDSIDEPVRTYSTGMTARLGFSVAANLDPEILLIDEVLAVGDARFQAKCVDKIREFQRRGVTIVFVSHELKHVNELCDRAVVIADTRAAFVGDVPSAVAFYDGLRSGHA